MSWDEPTLGHLPVPRPVAPLEDGLGDDSLENRITAIPEIPMSELAAGLLAASERDATSALPATTRAAEGTRDQALRRDPNPSLPAALSSPRLPRFEPSPPSSTSEPSAAPPSWTEPDLELPLSSTVDRPPTPSPVAGHPDDQRPLPDFDAVFSAHPLMQGPRSAAEAYDEALGPARDQMPTLDLDTDFEEPPIATRRGSDAVGARGAPSSPSGGARDPATDGARGTDAPSTTRVGRRSPRAPTGLELASEPAPPLTARSPHQELHDRYAVGDFTGALVVAESILEQDPDDLEAARYSQSCRDVLTQMYTARVGALDASVRVAIPPDQIRWLSLDHRAGFLLSLVDGASTVEEILDICGMPRLDALRLLYMMLEERVIAVERRGR